MQNMQEGAKGDDVEVSDSFKAFCRDSMVGREQIQQVSTVAQGAADALKEITERFKEAMATIKTQQATISTLSNT